MSALSSESLLSASPASARLSVPSSDTSDEQHGQMHDESNMTHHDYIVRRTAALQVDSTLEPPVEAYDECDPTSNPEHIIHLSSIEHCMPRSYIRMCLAYRMPDASLLPEIVTRLDNFIRKLVDAKPYLSGYVVAVRNPGKRVGAVEIRFSDKDFLGYPGVSVRKLMCDEVPYTYDQLDEMGLPPSAIKPELVSALSESADEDRAPVFRVQANIIGGGVIVSIYLHHCISDGTGAGLLISGSVLNDEFTFDRHLDSQGRDTPSLSVRLAKFANRKSIVRQQLSWSDPNQISDRSLKCKAVKQVPEVNGEDRAQGDGCILAFSLERLARLKAMLERETHHTFITANDTLLALLWHSMVKARLPSLADDHATTFSKLLIPINIRGKLKDPLPESYFGAAIDFATAQMEIDHLTGHSPASLIETAMEVRRAINSVDEPYIRQAIALARFPDPTIDVRDLQASNMDRKNGADMYVTSWEKLNCYDATFDLGLGQPDWVRKPWSRDPGSCIVLPYDDRKDHLEVVIQMTVADMDRLLQDQDFMSYVVRVIDKKDDA